MAVMTGISALCAGTTSLRHGGRRSWLTRLAKWLGRCRKSTLIGEMDVNKSETIGKLAEALSKAQGQIKGAVADSANPFFKSKYADLQSVVDALKEPYASNGIAYVQTTRLSDRQSIIVETILMHSSGEWISGELEVPAIKNDPQAFGSAMSYGRRYSLQAIAGIPTVDDDAEEAMGRKPEAKPPQTQTKTQTNPNVMTEPQRRKLWALMKGEKLSDDDAKALFAYVGAVTQRDASEFIENFAQRLNEWNESRKE